MANELTTWTPPEQKLVARGMKIALLLGVAFVAAIGIKAVAPTYIDALRLLQEALSNMIYTVILGAGLFIVGAIAWSTFVPGGKINSLLTQMINMAANKATWELLNVDPITPMTEERKKMVQRKQVFDEAFASFDGTISNMRETEEKYNREAADAERIASAANKQRTSNPDFEKTFREKSYEYGQYIKTAQEFADMRRRLEPVRANIKRLQEASETMIHNIDIDIRTQRDKWSAALQMERVGKSARSILGPKSQLAQDAYQIINTKYAEQIGRLDNLTDMTKPLLDSIDLDKASYSEELLDKWEKETTALLSGPSSNTIVPMPLATQQAPSASPTSLIGRLS